MEDLPGPEAFTAAQARVRRYLVPTPLRPARLPGVPAGHLKLEVEQPTGAFKVRGACSKILGLSEEERSRGVITLSTGNHGRAVAWVAHQEGIPATVCLSEGVPPNKVQALRDLDAEVVVHGRSQDEAGVRARELAEARGLALVHPFDDPEVIAGQGTIAQELLDELPDLAAVVVPVSGGGLAAGVALGLRAAGSAARVVGVSMRRGAAMHASLEAGRPVDVEEVDTLADSLRGGIDLDNRFTFRALRDHLDELHLVEEEDILAGMRWALAEHELRLEGAAAVGPGWALRHAGDLPEGPVVFLVTGQNVDEVSWARVLDPGSP